jgi:2-phosphosulfolactate phosphatase
MKIDIFQMHKHIPEGALTAKNVIIIDVLRATSTIITALANGANKIMTSLSIEEAFARK